MRFFHESHVFIRNGNVFGERLTRVRVALAKPISVITSNNFVFWMIARKPIHWS